jgi:hypothetical protein
MHVKDTAHIRREWNKQRRRWTKKTGGDWLEMISGFAEYVLGPPGPGSAMQK